MKYKLIGCVAVVAMLLVVFTAELFPDLSRQRYVQHRDASPKQECLNHTDLTLCTHLPLIQIITEGGEPIPGRIIDYTEDITPILETTSQGQDTVLATVKITDNSGANNHIADEPQLESQAIMHVRGNSSRAYDKLGYSIRLVDDYGQNNPQSVMGMDAHHEWVMHGPYLDKTLMRNYMWYNIAGEIMDYAPNVRFCEATLNGEYIGLYVMTESITAGNNARLRLSVDKKDNRFSGYLLRLDRGSSSTVLKNIDPFSDYSYRTLMDMNIVYPGAQNLTQELRDKIARDFSDFEKALYSYDYDDNLGYKGRIDVSSFVDYFLINEFTCNYDAGWLSTYIYKDVDGRFRLCIWDFNSACDNYYDSQTEPQRFQTQDALWYFMLTKDEDFTDRLIYRYRQLRKTYFNETYLNQYIDDVIAYLGDAIDRNNQKWGYSFEREYDLLKPEERNSRTYSQAIDSMKRFIHLRGEWMDKNIDTLRQYSAESKVKKFNEKAN